MNKITLLIKYDTSGYYPLRTPFLAFTNKDQAIIKCAELMQKKPPLLSWYLKDIELIGEIEDNSIDYFTFERTGGEIKILDPEDRAAYVDVVLMVDYANEPIAKKILSIKSIKICGSSIYDLELSEKFIKQIETLADAYRLEMLQE